MYELTCIGYDEGGIKLAEALTKDMDIEWFHAKFDVMAILMQEVHAHAKDAGKSFEYSIQLQLLGQLPTTLRLLRTPNFIKNKP